MVSSTYVATSIHRELEKFCSISHHLELINNSISGLNSELLKWPFLMVKSGLEFLFWNWTSPFRVAAVQCKKNQPGKAELA